MKVRSKLTLTFVFLITLTAIMYGLAAYSTIVKPIHDMEHKNNLKYSWLVVHELDEILGLILEDLELVSKQSIQHFLEDPETHTLVQPELAHHIFRNEWIRNVIFVSQDNDVLYNLYDSEEEFLVPPDKNKELTILPLQDTTHSLLRAAIKTYRGDGTFEGTAFVFLDMHLLMNNIVLKGPLYNTYVCIREESGELLYSTFDEPAEGEDMNSFMNKKGLLSWRFADSKDDPFYTTEVFDKKGDLLFVGAIIPTLGIPIFIEADFLGLDPLVSTMAQNMLMIGLAIVWISVWTAMVIGYRVMKPIEILSLGSERITSGEYGHRLNLKSNDEIGLLAEKFNTMAEAIEKRTLELEQTNQALKEQDQQKSRFLDTVAHDLRTPLTSIKSYTDLLRRFPDEDEKTKNEFLDIILQESDRMASLINDYLDLTKLENGTLAYRFQRVNLSRIILDMERVNQGECGLRNITLTSEIQDHLPPIWADPDRLRQVFSNLLSNAVKNSPPQGKIKIRAMALQESGNGNGEITDWIEVSILDQGPGIPENFRTKIFDKFSQIDNQPLHAKGGTGLGLPISKEIISRHSGRIWVEARQDCGAIFKFRLPITPSDDLPDN